MAALSPVTSPTQKVYRWYTKATAWTLLGLFLLHALSFTLIHTGFRLNQAYIAKKLCENRAKPQLQCEGRCVLIKSLKKAAQTEQDLQVHLKQLTFEYKTADVVPAFATAFSGSPITYPTTQSIGHPVSVSPSLYHPPQACFLS